MTFVIDCLDNIQYIAVPYCHFINTDLKIDEKTIETVRERF